jgi:hypothetical protein
MKSFISACEIKRSIGNCAKLSSENPEFESKIINCDPSSICKNFRDSSRLFYQACSKGLVKASKVWVDNTSSFLKDSVSFVNRGIQQDKYVLSLFYQAVTKFKIPPELKNIIKPKKGESFLDNEFSDQWLTKSISNMRTILRYVDKKVLENNQQYACFTEIAKTEMDCYAGGRIYDPLTVAGAVFKAVKLAKLVKRGDSEVLRLSNQIINSEHSIDNVRIPFKIEPVNELPQKIIGTFEFKLPTYAEHITRPILLQRNFWKPDFMTNPTLHNPNNYKYIVHGLLEDEVRNKHGLIHKDYINVLENPNLISKKGIISASYINNEINASYGKSGFILNVPEQNIFTSGPRDLGLPNLNSPRINSSLAEKMLNETARSNGLYTPRELTELNKKIFDLEDYNEIGIVGTTTNMSKVQVSGIFIKTDSSGRPLASPQRIEELTRVANKYHLPIIKLVEKSLND